ncbi:MAG: hypothetical protein IJ097_01950 [Bacilli bacterium]|nr:hypothetical protein [Bacilli bacterium]
MYNQYLIPANTKRGKLILGWFRPFDLALFGSGILVTLVLLAFLPLGSTLLTILVLSPALITAFLVMPVPNYHNMLNVIVELYQFLTNRQTYRWKGWCWKDGKGKK